MTALAFRNLDVDPTADVATWPAEAIEIALDRGTLSDWHRIATEIGRSPWGRIARTTEQVAAWGEHAGIDRLMERIIATARGAVVDAGRERWAAYVRGLRASTGLTMREFAGLAGTSASRVSDYENGRVAPSTETLARLEHAAGVVTPAKR